MEKITFTVECVTPLLLSGADRTVAELRPGQIEKQIRWWWRWARGPEILNPDNHEEADIFGSTDGASRVIVRISRSDETTKSVSMCLSDLVKRFGHRESLSYVFFPYRENDAARGVLFPGTSFRMSINFMPGLSTKQRQQVLGAFWLLVFLGGIGSRSRRGVGAVRVSSGPNNFMLPTSGTEKFLSTRLASILNEFAPQDFDEMPPFTCYSASARVFLMNDESRSWQAALHRAIDLLKRFRSVRSEDQTDPELYRRYRDDLRTFYDFLDDGVASEGSVRTIEYSKAQLGLPVEVVFHQHDPPMKIGISGRRASPIMVKVLKCDENLYRTIISIFPATPLDPAISLSANRFERVDKRNWESRNGDATVDLTEFDVVSRFCESVAEVPGTINLLPV